MPIKWKIDLRLPFYPPGGNLSILACHLGVLRSPSVIQILTDSLLNDVKNHAQNYINDVIVFSQLWEEHMTHVDDVQDRIKPVGLTAKSMGPDLMRFLGDFLLGETGLVLRPGH